jgi:hypothetical protein
MLLLFAQSRYEIVLSSSKRSHFRLSMCNLLPRSHPQQSISDKAGEINWNNEPTPGKVLPTHKLPNNKHYSFGVSEKAIGSLDCNTGAAMAGGRLLMPTCLRSIRTCLCWVTIWLYQVPAHLLHAGDVRKVRLALSSYLHSRVATGLIRLSWVATGLISFGCLEN